MYLWSRPQIPTLWHINLVKINQAYPFQNCDSLLLIHLRPPITFRNGSINSSLFYFWLITLYIAFYCMFFIHIQFSHCMINISIFLLWLPFNVKNFNIFSTSHTNHLRMKTHSPDKWNTSIHLNKQTYFVSAPQFISYVFI